MQTTANRKHRHSCRLELAGSFSEIEKKQDVGVGEKQRVSVSVMRGARRNTKKRRQA